LEGRSKREEEGRFKNKTPKKLCLDQARTKKGKKSNKDPTGYVKSNVPEREG
jgi:hypothetical protein